MMLTIQRLPSSTRYQDLKSLLRQQCNITDFILDNLVTDNDGSKKVRIGLSDDSDASQVIKALDGYRIMGCILKVVPVGKTPSNPAAYQGNFDDPGNFNQGSRHVGQPANVYAENLEQNRPAPWENNQWTPNHQEVSQNSFSNYQPQSHVTNDAFMQQQLVQPQRQDLKQFGQSQRDVYPQGRQEQPFGYQQKFDTNINAHKRPVNRSHVLRTVELVDTQVSQPDMLERYPPTNQGLMPQEKPLTIMKDNFQGPSQYNVEPQGNQPHFAHSQQSPWAQSQNIQPYKDERKNPPMDQRQMLSKKPEEIVRGGRENYKNDSAYAQQRGVMHGRVPAERRISPSSKEIPPFGQRMSPSRRRMSPVGRKISPSGRRMSPSGRRISPSGRRISPSGRRISPSGRRMSPSGRRMSPSGSRMSPSGRRISPFGPKVVPFGRKMSPTERRMSPTGRRMSPTVRRMSPTGRKMSPTGRRMSPTGRKMSPTGRRMSPTGRRMSPMGRRMSPGRRISPSARKLSPSGPKHIMMERRLSPGDRRAPRRVSPSRRRDSPPPGPPRADDRYSPSRRHPDKPEKYSVPDLRAGSSKHIRPAYDLTEAQKQDVYSGGYRPSAQSAAYPAAGARPPEPLNLPWQHDRDNSMYAAQMNKDGDRREAPRMDIARANEQRMPMEQPHSARKSRSPIRDRYKRHSPSPRSPRRSWALEKRRSPDVREAPPPPMWPGRTPRDDDTYVKPPRASYDDRLDKGDAIKTPAVWEQPRFEGKEPPRRAAPGRPDDERRFAGEAPGRMHRREPSYEPQETRFAPPPQREPKFTRENFTMLEQRADEPRRRDDAYDRKPVFEEAAPRDMPRQFDRDPEPGRPGRFPPRPDDRREPFTKLRSSLDKEIEDVHKRALEFSRKTEEFKRDKKYDGDSRGDMDRLEGKHYEQRHKLYREEDPRPDFRSRHEGRSEPAEPRGDTKWSLDDDSGPRIAPLSSNAFAKREKAIEELTDKIMKKHDFRADSVTQRRVTEELKKALARKVREIFGDRDTSFIEVVIKFNARYDDRAQEKIFDEVLSSFPSYTRSLKRTAQASPSEVPAKRRSPGINPQQDIMQKLNNQQIPEWDFNLAPASGFMAMPFPMAMPQYVPQMPVVMDPGQYMVPSGPFANAHSFNEASDPQPSAAVASTSHRYSPAVTEPSYDPIPTDGYNLYLCKDDFEPFSENQAEYLKRYLISRIVRETETSHGWAPDITLKGLQGSLRYELHTRDETSKNWMVSLDFSEFALFNVLVYSKEELWYERAAVWLPGHSRCRNIEPLTKLKLQNKTLDGIQIGLKQGIVRARAVPKPSAPVKRLATKQYVEVAKVDRTGPPSAKKSKSSEEVDKRNITSVQKPTTEAKVAKTPPSQAQAPRAPGAGAGPRGERAPEVHCELNALMSRMLNAELQDIMIKVWQQLPDKPQNEAEALVVDKLRNEIGDDLRNVIGLDVTKRLLNIHNPLLVKITFSTRPDIASLKKFFKYHNVVNFQIADTTKNTFMAQLRSIKDFDNLCSHTKLRCGGAQVTVTSCYNFTKCPVKIKTNFVDKTETEDSKAETMANNEQNLKKEEKDIKTPIKKEINEKTVLTSRPVAKNEKVDLKSNISQGKSENVNVTAASNPNKNNECDDKVKPTDSKTNSPLAKEPEKKKFNPKVNAVNNNIGSPVKVEAKPNVASKPTSAPGKEIQGNNVTTEIKPVEKSMSNIEKTADVKLDTKTAASSAEKSGDAKSNVMTVASSTQESVSAKSNADAASNAEKSADAKSNVTTVASSTQKTVSAKPNANNTSSAEKSVDAKSNVMTVASSTHKSVSAKPNANAASSAEKSVDAKSNVMTVASSTHKSVSAKPNANAASSAEKSVDAKSNVTTVASSTQKTVTAKPNANNTTSSAEKSVNAKPKVKTVASSAQISVSGKSSTNNSNVQKTLEAKANTKNVSVAQKSVDDKCKTKNVPSNVNKALKQSKFSDKKNLDEYEEMNDEEILQLLSGGIVLDECGAED